MYNDFDLFEKIEHPKPEMDAKWNSKTHFISTTVQPPWLSDSYSRQESTDLDPVLLAKREYAHCSNSWKQSCIYTSCSLWPLFWDGDNTVKTYTRVSQMNHN